MSKGIAWKFGDNISTTNMVPGQFLANWNDEPSKLKDYCFIDIRPEFSKEVREGDIVVGGKNFGCGSSRESAPTALKVSGIKVVIAESFGRIFFRNCFNLGILAIESQEIAKSIDDGDTIVCNFEKSQVINVSKNEIHQYSEIPEQVRQILEQGGLVNYIKNKFKSSKERK
ncbi:MAG: 3-isopropylmalate dehydratase small subunit [Clostridia bacterium]|nr:3-isopropylmalate dehydratase small subunit [Clostridia bacterium]